MMKYSNMHRIVVGDLATNCYLIWDEGSKQTLIIDPGAQAEKIQSFIDGHNLKPVKIINTHGHRDHIGANNAFDIDVFIHSNDTEALTDSKINMSAFFGPIVTSKQAAGILKDNDIIKIGQLELKIIHTPGHSPGGICLLYKDILFSGDTLFFEGVGRTDLIGGDYTALKDSIANKLFTLPDETVVYPGHGPRTTIGHEKQNFTI